MKVYCITMARDEASILPVFVDQVQEFFDEWLFLDHGSVDSGPTYCRERCGDRVEILRLFANGYPQSEVTTLLARRAFQEKGADVVIALDCDEFLPFETRAKFEEFLARHRRDGAEAVLMPWLNLAPEKLDGSNIFGGQFRHGEPSGRHSKVVVFRELFDRVPRAQFWQGNHGISCGSDAPARSVETPDTPVLHIPIRSLTQFALKLTNGSRLILNDHACHSRGLGMHWVDLALDYRTRSASDAWVRRLAIGYPDLAPEAALEEARVLNFGFPYLRSEYAEAAADTAAAILRPPATQQLADIRDVVPGSFKVVNERGDVVVERASADVANRPAAGHAAPAFSLAQTALGERYADLVEPLFSLPVRLQPSAWIGHVPFLFALFRMLRPTNYVELGVHLGASLTAAASAAETYRIPMRLYGIDTWQGDEHAGLYQGDQMYEDLRTFMAGTFPNVTLIRSLFSEARPSFRPGSIDVLHIDGLHTYDAVKDDFLSWLPAMSDDGVVLFHDICVLDRGFGVHRFWAELKRHYTTFEFHHSHGLGVLFLNRNLPAIAPLVDISSDEIASATYRSLAADIAGALPERMPSNESGVALAENEGLKAKIAAANARAEQANAQLSSTLNSTSWRVTAPLRALKRMIG